jgi:hypothetical protein
MLQLLPIFALLGFLLIFFGHVILSGQILSAADMIYETPFFAAHAPDGFVRATNALLSDQVYQFAPWRSVVWESLQHGQLPLWDPHSLAGRPILATQQSAVFYPLNLLFLVLPYAHSLLWGAILRLWIAGIGMYLLGRHYQWGQAAALIAATSFMLCGFLIVWLGHPHTNAAVWLPALILAGDRLLLAQGRAALIRAIAILALIIAIQFSGGHVQTSIDMLFGFGVYYLLRWWHVIATTPQSNWQKAARLVLIPSLALVLGCTIAAPQLVPFLEWLPLSEVLGSRSAGGFQPGSTELWRMVTPAVLLFFPNIFGNPTWSTAYWTPVVGQNYNEEALYFGVLPIVLACCAVILRCRRDPLVAIWAVIALVSLGRALRLPLFEAINQLPILNLAVSGRMRLVTIFGMCVLAGIGADQLLSSVQASRSMQRLWLGMLIGFVLVGLAMRGAVVLGAIWPAAPEQIRDLRVYLPVGFALAGIVLVLIRHMLSQRVYQIVFVSIVAIDLIIYGQHYNPSVAVQDFYPNTPIAARIKQDPGLFRVSAPHADIIPEAATMLGLADIRGLDFRTLWYTWYLSAVRGRAGSLLITGFTRLDSPLLRMLNIKYIIAARDQDFANDPTLRFVMRDGRVALWEVIDPTPRAYMIYTMLVTDTEQDTITVLGRNPKAAPQRVIIPRSEAPPALEQVLPQPHGVVENLSYAAEQTSWRVETPTNGYLFVSDAFYPGWQAEIDGQPTLIYRANLAFRAVYVPAGEHTIIFRFQPRLVTAALILSGVALVVVLAIIFLPSSTLKRK